MPLFRYLAVPLFALLVAAPCAYAVSGPKQAVFDIKATGHYVYDHGEDWQPGSQCPLNRGTAHEAQTLDVTVHYRATVQTGFGRWYVNPIHSRAVGRGALRKTRSKNIERQECGDAGWQPDTTQSEAPVDKTCRRPVQTVLDLGRKKGLIFLPNGWPLRR